MKKTMIKKYNICSNKLGKFNLITNKETLNEDIDDILIKSYEWFK